MTVGLLMEHRLRQDAHRAEWGEAYQDHGLVFAREDGTPLGPDYVSKRFAGCCGEAGIRRVRLHDLRHGRASLLAAGVDIAVVSKIMGHGSISITADTYSRYMIANLRKAAAEAASALVREGTPGLTANWGAHLGHTKGPRRSRRSRDSAWSDGAPPGTRTPNPRIKSPLLCQLS